MTIATSDYALLAQDAYHDREIGKQFLLGGVKYRAIDHADKASGFQATAYERMDTHEVVIAYRGTEFDREPLKDGGVDAGMVLAGVNAQSPDAMAFTQKVMADAKALEAIDQQPVHVTVTGHSLGGTLAEIAASRYGLHGETFNAYGAAGLLDGVPKGGHQVIDHVRATDVVSAASPHFGEVRVYAAPQDIETLTKAGYRDNSTLLSPRDPFQAIDFKAHAIDNFVPDSKLLGQSIISPQGEALYNEHKTMIDRYRNDVLDLRTGLSAGWEIPKAAVDLGERAGHALVTEAEKGLHAVESTATHLAHETGEALDHARQHIEQGVAHGVKAVEHGAQAAAHAVEHGAEVAMQATERVYDNVRKDLSHGVEAAAHSLHAAEEAIGNKASHAFDTLTHPGSWFDKDEKATLNQPTHPDHALFQQAREAVHRLDASHARAPDQRSEQMAGSLTVAARQGCLERIDHVVLSDDASRAYAVQGDLQSSFKRIAQVSTAEAMSTPLAESSAQWARQQQAQQANPPAPTPAAQTLQPGPAPAP